MLDAERRRLSSSERLLRLFREGFSVMDLAEPLLSLDEAASRAQARELMRREAARHLGVRRDGRLVGHVRMDDLADEGDLRRFEPISEAEILDQSAGLKEVVDGLTDRDVAFVRVLGAVTAVVQRRDLEKPPMRMWLFGMVSLIETNVTWAVRELFEGDAWTENLAPGRVEKARGLRAERQRRGLDADLLSCLQLSDKLGLLVKDERHRELLGIRSRREARKTIKQLESLRNSLAHAQPIADDNWPAMQMLSAAVDGIVSASRARSLVGGIRRDAAQSDAEK